MEPTISTCTVAAGPAMADSMHRVAPQECTMVKHWAGARSSLFPKENTPALPILHHSLALALRQTGPGKSLSQRHHRSQAEAQSPQFLQPQCPEPQPTPHHSLALDVG